MTDAAKGIEAVGSVGANSVLDRFADKFKAELGDVKQASDSFYGSLSNIGNMGQSLDPSAPGAPTQNAISAIQEGSIMSAKLALQQVRFSMMHGGVVAATSTFKQLLKTN